MGFIQKLKIQKQVSDFLHWDKVKSYICTSLTRMKKSRRWVLAVIEYLKTLKSSKSQSFQPFNFSPFQLPFTYGIWRVGIDPTIGCHHLGYIFAEGF
jgi:hypothetical protein